MSDDQRQGDDLSSDLPVVNRQETPRQQRIRLLQERPQADLSIEEWRELALCWRDEFEGANLEARVWQKSYEALTEIAAKAMAIAKEKDALARRHMGAFKIARLLNDRMADGSLSWSIKGPRKWPGAKKKYTLAVQRELVARANREGSGAELARQLAKNQLARHGDRINPTKLKQLSDSFEKRISEARRAIAQLERGLGLADAATPGSKALKAPDPESGE